MNYNIIESPFFRHPKAWWFPFISLSIILHGIIFLAWNLQPIVMIFWWEVMLMLAAAFVRMLFALDGRPFFDTILHKIRIFVFSGLIAIVFMMLTVTFTFKVFDGGFNREGFEELPSRINILVAGQVLGLIIHYFANGRYKTANPMSELASTFFHLFVILALIMALTMHLIPKYPHLNQAMWVGIAILGVKFIVDMFFSKINSPLKID